MLSLSITFLLVISFAASVISYITNSLFSKRISATESDFNVFMIFQGIICGATILIISGGIGEASAFSVLLGILFGAVCAVQTLSYLKAIAIGPLSYSMVMVSLSTVIPTLSGIFWGETITAMQIVGIVLMIVCIALSPEKNKDAEEKKASMKWLALCMLSTVLNGAVGVLQKVHQTSGAHKDELPVFLICAFATSVLISAAILVVRKIKHKNEECTKISFRFKLSHILITLGAGASLGFCHVVNLFLSGKLPAAVLFPIINICPMVLTSVAAMFLFNERLSVKRWIGIAIGILSTLFVGGVITL